MINSFNLLYEQWIPCYDKSGKRVELGIVELFEKAHQLDRIEHPTPIVTASLYRLILAILHSSLRGPKSSVEWNKLYQNKKFDKDIFFSYLTENVIQRFDLFHPESPFYQCEIAYKNQTSIKKLVFHFADSGGAVTFNHQGYLPYEVKPSEAACLLISYQYSWFGGTIGSLPPKSGSVSHTESPARKGITYLIRGENLFQTLMFNLVVFNEKKPFISYEEDQPAWEMEDPFTDGQIPYGFLDYLTWQNLRIKLFPKETQTIENIGIVLGRGLESDELQTLNIRDPYHCYNYNEKKGYSAYKFQNNKLLWRDSSSLFMTFHDNNAKIRAPYNLSCLKDYLNAGYIKPVEFINLMCFGIRSGENAGLIIFYRQENFRFPVNILQKAEDYYPLIKNAVDRVENLSRILAESIKCLILSISEPTFVDEAISFSKIEKTIRLLRKKKSNGKELNSIGMTFFWSEMELEFQNYLIKLSQNSEEAQDWWRERTYNLMNVSFDKAADIITPSGKRLLSRILAEKIKNFQLFKLEKGDYL